MNIHHRSFIACLAACWLLTACSQSAIAPPAAKKSNTATATAPPATKKAVQIATCVVASVHPLATDAGIEPTARAEEIDVEGFVALARVFARISRPA